MTVTETRTYIVCPHCQAKAGGIDHLKAPFATRWYCAACGGAYKVTLTDAETRVEGLSDRCIKTWDLLVLPPQTDPVYFVVSGMRFEGHDGPTATWSWRQDTGTARQAVLLRGA